MSNAVVLGAALVADTIKEKAHQLRGKLMGLSATPWVDYPVEVDVYNVAELGDIISWIAKETPTEKSVTDVTLYAKQVHYLAGLIIFAHIGHTLGDKSAETAYQLGVDALYRPNKVAAMEQLVGIEQAVSSDNPTAALEVLSAAANAARAAAKAMTEARKAAKPVTWTDISADVAKFGNSNPSDLVREVFHIVGAEQFIAGLVNNGYKVELTS